jgi:hypothetical protein
MKKKSNEKFYMNFVVLHYLQTSKRMEGKVVDKMYTFRQKKGKKKNWGRNIISNKCINSIYRISA